MLIKRSTKLRGLLKILVHHSLNIHILVHQRVSVHDVKNVLEGVLCSLAGVSELGQKLRLHHGVRLGDNEIVPIWVLVESVLKEIS